MAKQRNPKMQQERAVNTAMSKVLETIALRPASADPEAALREGREQLQALAKVFDGPAPQPAPAPPKGDQIFMWYWGAGAAPETWSTAYSTNKEAAAHAHGNRPHGDYTIIEADCYAIQIDAPALFNVDAILADLERRNPQSWPNGFPYSKPEERADLAAKLGDCLDRWLRKGRFDTTTAIFTIRSSEYFPDRRAPSNRAQSQ